jgi:glycosyltransferase involved in cell wall biosynthesis
MPRLLIWYWSGGGGGSQFAVRLAHRLKLCFGDDAIVLSLRADDPTAAWAEELGLRVLRAEVRSNRRRPLETLSGLSDAARILAQHAEGADAVILPMNFAAASPLSLTLRKPLVYCAHDPAPHPGDYAAQMQRITQAVLLARAAHVVALSDYAAGQLQGVRARLHVAPLSSVFEPQAAPPRAPGPLRFAVVGRMIAYKGLDVLADALDAIKHRNDWRLVMAGDGPALTDAMMARFDAPHIELRRAWLSDADLEAVIASCDVLLAPYTSATQSGVISQALAFGKPCIVTPVGALPEQIGDAGWIARDVSAPAFADAMRAALDDSAALGKASDAALRRAQAAWDADAWGWLA